MTQEGAVDHFSPMSARRLVSTLHLYGFDCFAFDRIHFQALLSISLSSNLCSFIFSSKNADNDARFAPQFLVKMISIRFKLIIIKQV